MDRGQDTETINTNTFILIGGELICKGNMKTSAIYNGQLQFLGLSNGLWPVWRQATNRNNSDPTTNYALRNVDEISSIIFRTHTLTHRFLPT